MMKKLFIGGVLLLSTAFAASAFAAQPEVPADGIKMNRMSKVVIFNHSTHKDIKCTDCHHPVDGKEDFRSCATAGCHDNFDKKDKSVNSLYQAVHKAKDNKFNTCVACHVATAGDDKDKKKELAGCAKSKCHP